MIDGSSLLRQMENNPSYTLENTYLDPSNYNNQAYSQGIKNILEWKPQSRDNYVENKIQNEKPNLITK